MSTLETLRRVIAPGRPSAGRVVQVGGDRLLVALGSKTVSVQRAAGDATEYSVGDRVAVEGGQTRGRRGRGATYWL